MAQESKDERHASKNDHVDHSHRQDAFGSDSEGEEEEEARVDLEEELVSALKELSRRVKNVAIIEQNPLIRCLKESEKRVLELKTQQEDTKVCRCNDLAFELEVKDKEYQQLVREMEILLNDLEKCQDELKVRIWFDGISDALEKMLKKEKHVKDTNGLGSGTGEYSTSKDTSQKDIHFVSSYGNSKCQTFTVKNTPGKKVDVTTTGEDLKREMVLQEGTMQIQKEKGS